MTDQEINDQVVTTSRVIAGAREMVRQLDHHTAELANVLANFKSHHQWEFQLRQREATVLAREDRCTVREREIEEWHRNRAVPARSGE